MLSLVGGGCWRGDGHGREADKVAEPKLFRAEACSKLTHPLSFASLFLQAIQ